MAGPSWVMRLERSGIERAKKKDRIGSGNTWEVGSLGLGNLLAIRKGEPVMTTSKTCITSKNY